MRFIQGEFLKIKIISKINQERKEIHSRDLDQVKRGMRNSSLQKAHDIYIRLLLLDHSEQIGTRHTLLPKTVENWAK